MKDTSLRQTVGREIHWHRESQNMSLHKLAVMAGTSYTHLWKVENAKVSVGIDLLGRICEALDVPMSEIVCPQEREGSSALVSTGE